MKWGELLWLGDTAQCSWETELKPAGGGLQQLHAGRLNREPPPSPESQEGQKRARQRQQLCLCGPSVGGGLTFPSAAKLSALTNSPKARCRMLFIHVRRLAEYRFQQEIWQGHRNVCESEAGAAVIFRCWKLNIWGCVPTWEFSICSAFEWFKGWLSQREIFVTVQTKKTSRLVSVMKFIFWIFCHYEYSWKSPWHLINNVLVLLPQIRLEVFPTSHQTFPVLLAETRRKKPADISSKVSGSLATNSVLKKVLKSHERCPILFPWLSFPFTNVETLSQSVVSGLAAFS